MKVPRILLSNGHVLRYVIASGGLANGNGWPWDQPLRLVGLIDERLFTTVLKTITMEECLGNFRWWNPLGCIRFMPDGVLNAFALTNEGIHKLHPKIKRSAEKAAMIGSILGTPEELCYMAELLNDCDFVALEVNASCPNAGEDILQNSERVIESFQRVKAVSRFPVIGKLSVAHDLPRIVPYIRGLVEAIDINSVPFRIAFPGCKSPLDHLGGGGVSGKAAQPFTWGMVEELVAMTDIPVIGPSIWEYGDIDNLIMLGAKAMSFGSLLMPHPYRPLNPLRPTAYVRRHMRENGI